MNKTQSIHQIYYEDDNSYVVNGAKITQIAQIDTQFFQNNPKQNVSSFAHQPLRLGLRGGGCGASQDNSLEIEFSSKNNLPRDFFQKLKMNCDCLRINSQILLSDKNSLNNIMLSLQWFHYNSEFINDCAQNIENAGEIYAQFLEYASDILEILPNYIRFQGFIAYKVLQIVNELLRVIFSFQRKNENRQLDEQQKKLLLEYVEKIQSEMEVESTEIWKSGIEYELSLIEIMLHNCNINYSEMKQQSISFVESLIKSAMTLQCRDDLIDQILGCGKYLFNLAYDAVSYPKEVYYTYYIFQNQKWSLIKSLKNDGSVQFQIDNLIKTYQSHIETSENWMIHYSWIQMITDLLCYRIRIHKDSLIQYSNALQKQKKWNNLIQRKVIKPLPYQDYGVIFLYKNYQFIEFDTKENGLNNKIGKFQYLCQALMYEKFNSEFDLWNIYINFNFQQQQQQQELEHPLNDYLYFQKMAREFLGRLKQQFEISYKNLKLRIDSLLVFINSFCSQKIKYDISFYQDELETRKEKLYNVTTQLIYISGEIIEKVTLIITQTKNIQYQNLPLTQNGFQIFQETQEVLTNVKKQFVKFIQEIQLLEVECLKIKLGFNTFQNTKFDQNGIGFQNLMEQLDSYFIKEKIVHDILYDCLINNKNNQSTQIFKETNFQDILLQIILSTTLNFYYEKIIDSLEFDNKDLIQIDFQVKQIIHLLQFFQNLYCIQQGKAYQILQCFETMKTNYQQISNIEDSQQQIQIKHLVLDILENSKNIFEASISSEMNEKQMIQQVMEFLALLEKNISLITCFNNQNHKDKEKTKNDIAEALKMISEFQELIFEFQNALAPNKDKNIKKIVQEINLQYQSWSNKVIHNFNQEKEQQRSQCCELVRIFQSCDKVLRDLLEQLKQVQSHFNIEIAVQQIDQINFPLQPIPKSKTCDRILPNIKKSLQSEMEKIQQIYSDFQVTEQVNQGINYSELVFILSASFRPIEDQSFNVDQIYIEIIDVLNNLNSAEQIKYNGNDFKVRECLAINLIKVQACIQEEEILNFVQWNMKEMWVKERDERVKKLLKNKDLLEMQRKLFSKDLKSFSAQLQSEMQEKLEKLSGIEQGLRLEGNEEYRKKMQDELMLAYQEIDQYVENISDMSAQMNISLAFLKEIVKDLKSIKTKIDSLSENVNQIADDVRKLRGKSFQELLQIRKKKVLKLAKLNEADSIYIPLKTIEYCSKTGDKINSADGSSITQLLVENFKNKDSNESLKGEINEFLWSKNNLKHDVLLIRGQAGSGKSRSTRKIEEFLWKMQGSESKWIPIYISLPQIKNPKFNLFEQAMDSEYYNFDQPQIRQLKEAIRMKKINVIFILDSYDEMKQDCLQQNLIITNNFLTDFDIADSGKFVKFIITTRIEILHPTRYKNWFCGSSLENMKDVELIKFDQDQIEDYLQQYVKLSAKRIIKSLYEFVKQLNESDFDLEEFQEIWLLVEEIVIECSRQNKKSKYLFENREENRVVQNISSHKVFKYLKDEQIITLQKDLQQLWSSTMFQSSIKSANIEPLLTTPFMVEIIVYVLPFMRKRGIDSNQFKENFSLNLQNVLKTTEKSIRFMSQYQHIQKQLEEQPKSKKLEKNQKYTQQANEIIEILERKQFFLNYSPIDQIVAQDGKFVVRANHYKIGQQAELALIALKMKQYTIYEFYDSFIVHYHNQQISKLSQLGKIANVESFSIDVFEFSQSLALDLTINQQISLSQRLKGKLKLKIYENDQDQINAWEEQYLNNIDDNQEYLKLIRSCILLTSKGNSFQFTHKSIQEFFVAKYVHDELSKVQLSQDKQTLSNSEILRKNQFNKSQFNISKFHYQGVIALLLPQLSYQRDIDKKLIQIVKLSTKDEFVPSASNSIYLLSKRKTFLGCMDFKQIKLRDTNLFALSFFGSDFSDSLFENVIIDSCNFNFCNFNNATWNNILCKEMPYLQGHTQEILVVAFSNDGNLLASGAADSLAIIWNLNTFKVESRIDHKKNDQVVKISCLSFLQNDQKYHKKNDQNVKISCLSFLQNDQKLITAGDNGIISIFNISQLSQIVLMIELKEHYEPIVKVIVTLDEKTMYSLDKQSLVIIWNLDNVFSCKDVVFEKEKMDLIGMYFTSDGNFFFAIDKEQKCICSFEVKSQNCLNKIYIGDLKFQQLFLSQNDCYLAAIDERGRVAIWDVSLIYNFKSIYFEENLGQIDDFSFSSDNQNIVLLCGGVLVIKNFHDFLDESIKYHNCMCIAISQENELLALLQRQMIQHADCITNQIINSIALPNEENLKEDEDELYDSFSPIPPITIMINSNEKQSFSQRKMIFSNDGSSFVYEISQHVMIIWNMNLYQKQNEVSIYSNNNFISKDLNFFAALYDHTLIIKKPLKEFQQHFKQTLLSKVHRFALQKQNSIIAISFKEQLIFKDLNHQTNKNILKLEFSTRITCLAISQRHNIYLIGFTESIQIKRNLNDQLETFTNKVHGIRVLATSYDDTILGGICDIGLILWKLESKEKIFEQQCDYQKLIFSTCKEILAYIHQGYINVYHYASKKQSVIKYIEEKNMDIAFSPSNLYLASVGQELGVFVQNLNTQFISKTMSYDDQAMKFVLFIDSDTFLTVSEICVKVWKISAQLSVVQYIIKQISQIQNISFQQIDQQLLIQKDYSLLIFNLVDFYNTDFFQINGDGNLFTLDNQCRILGFPKNKKITIMNLYDQQNQYELDNQANTTALSFSSDDQLLANYGYDYQLKVWNLKNKKIMKKVFFRSEISYIIFDRSNQYLLSSGRNFMLWNIQQKKSSELLNIYVTNNSFERSTILNNYFGLFKNNTCVIYRQWKENKKQKLIFNLPDRANRIKFSSKIYMAASSNSEVKIWNFNDLEQCYLFSDILGFAFNQDEQLLLILRKSDQSSANSNCILINLKNQQKQFLENTSINIEFSAKFLSDEQFLLIRPNFVRVYKIHANHLEEGNIYYHNKLCKNHNYAKQQICIKRKENYKTCQFRIKQIIQLFRVRNICFLSHNGS